MRDYDEDDIGTEAIEGCEQNPVTLKDLELCGDVQIRYIPYQQAVKCRGGRLQRDQNSR